MYAIEYAKIVLFQYVDEMAVILAGRVSEVMIFNHTSFGNQAIQFGVFSSQVSFTNLTSSAVRRLSLPVC